MAQWVDYLVIQRLQPQPLGCAACRALRRAILEAVREAADRAASVPLLVEIAPGPG